MRFLILLFCLVGFTPAFAADCDPQAFARLAQGGLNRLPPLEKMVADAGLDGDLLRKHGKAVVDAREFLSLRKEIGPGYLLAVDRMRFASQIFSHPKGLRHWQEGYSDFAIFPNASGHTDEYMSRVTESGQAIVFLVPRDLMGRPGVTQDEMNWLLAHPEKMKNVTFVFGAYDLVPDKLLRRYEKSRDLSEINALLNRD